ncbi:MAG: hypothetical protein AB1610_10435 [Nitrospirota bacterium]
MLEAKLPNGNTISYDHDPMGRRIAKRVNGIISEKYLWVDQITLLAIYDKNDNLIMRFNYADDRMPISMESNCPPPNKRTTLFVSLLLMIRNY